ncbi:hypothetical protein AB0M46_49630 [Dactylosporangium sp. NPDC051485]|uniref:hypothetical protein n=1 Tax=Dactylosporangium sp. NPDC051485 TaxID=3154846 RepID=UPI0034439EE0
MDGHWDWSEGGDDADTADLGGDTGHDLHGDFGGEDYGADFGHHDFGGEDHHLGGGDDLHAQHGGDLDESLGTEHATAEYDQALHGTGGGEHGEPGYDEDHSPAGHHPDVQDGHDAAGEQHEAGFGTDPDVHAAGDDPAWHEPQFPQQLDLQDPPEPVDGFPWSDADVLGGPDHSLSAAFDPAVVDHAAEPSGLADYAGLDVPPGTDPWSLLLGSEDPATSSLATFWAPQ